MIPKNLAEIISKNDCINDINIEIKSDTHNSYNYELWTKYVDLNHNKKSKWIDNHNYTLEYTNGENMKLHAIKSTLTNNIDYKIKYRFSKIKIDESYSIDEQIPMIKLFMSVFIARKYIKYSSHNDGY